MDTNSRLTTKIRLRQLRCFVTVARKKSFVLASDELGLTQPAVSRSIKELEKAAADCDKYRHCGLKDCREWSQHDGHHTQGLHSPACLEFKVQRTESARRGLTEFQDVSGCRPRFFILRAALSGSLVD